MKKLFLIIVALHVISFVTSELEDANEIEKFCYPEAFKNSRKSCECNNDNAPPWGVRAVKIDCSYKSLKSNELSEVLPLYVDNLDLSWNAMVEIPQFSSDSLRLLNLMHNNISVVGAKNFAKLPNLRELYLSWNSLQILEANSFDQLAHLQVLDLSHNNLHVMAVKMFAPLKVLESLSLSWNRQLNQSQDIQTVDFYQNYGVNMNLSSLRLKACGLNNIILPKEATLQLLDLRRNVLKKIPEHIPQNLEILDLSDNLFETFRKEDTTYIAHVKELYFEDMSSLTKVEQNSFEPLKSLKKVSFLNSRRLSSFDGHAFGEKSNEGYSLRTIIFRGTAMRTFNSTLSPIFTKLTELDLNGLPLHCDCHMRWIKELQLETNGRCFRPSRLKGMLLSNVRSNDLSCDTWPTWVYGLIILGLIILCSGGIYLIVWGLRPNRKVQMRRKVGAGSPYARVTIEPNRQENNYY